MKGVINIYDSISSYGINSKQILSTLDNYKSQNITEIDVFINSPGGSVFEGFAIFNLFRDFKVNTFVNGIAASIASVIALAGEKLHMYQNSYLMIHNPWTMAIGDHHDMNEAGEVLEDIRDTLIDLYKSKTGMDEEELKAFCDQNTFINSARAKELGFADEIIENYPSQKFVAFYSDVLDNENNLVSQSEDLLENISDLETKIETFVSEKNNFETEIENLTNELNSLKESRIELEEINSTLVLNIADAESKFFDFDFTEFVKALEIKFEAGTLPPYVYKSFKDLVEHLTSKSNDNKQLNDKFISLLSFLVDLKLLSDDKYIEHNNSDVDHSSFVGMNVTKETVSLYDKIMKLSQKENISFTNAYNKIKNGVN